jgi:hypothetical protein
MTPAMRARGCAVTMPPIPLRDLSARRLSSLVFTVLIGTRSDHGSGMDAARARGLLIARAGLALTELQVRAARAEH